MMNESLLTATLQIARLKGRVTAAAVATSLTLTESEATALLQTLKDTAAIIETNGTCRLTPVGREQLALRVVHERSTVDQAALRIAYEEFHPLNSEFKEIVTAWQIRNGVPNDHTDTSFDAAIVGQLVGLDARFAPLLSRMLSLAPRLGPYQVRFRTALQKLQAGDQAWMARPILDSYHTVWFELHEDLIGLLGLSREAEASAGRAE